MPITSAKASLICRVWKANYHNKQNPVIFGCLTDRRLDHMPLLIPPPLLNPLLIPFLRCTKTVLMFLIWPKLLTILFIGLWFSGRKKILAVSSLWFITFRSKLGRRKYCRRRCLPCGVLARWWKRPYTERPSLDPEEAFVGPWLCVLGLDSDCSICKEAKVSVLTSLCACLQHHVPSSAEILNLTSCLSE